MNAILSIIVSIAMFFGGMTTLPAEPETQTSWTLSDVALTLDGETYAIGPAACLTSALGENRLQLQFEVENGGKTMLPVAGEITPDGARFSIGQSGTVYELSGETLLSMMGGDAESLAALEEVSPLLTGYFDYIRRCGEDPAYAYGMMQGLIDQIVSITGMTAEPAEVEIDGEKYPVTRATGEVKAADLFRLLDAWRESSEPFISSYAQLVLDLLNGQIETAYESYEAMWTELSASDPSASALAFPFEIAYAVGDELNYIDMRMDVPDVGSFGAESYAMDELVRSSVETSFDSSYELADGRSDFTQSMRMDMEVSGPADAPFSVRMNVESQSENTSSGSYTPATESAITTVGPIFPQAAASGAPETMATPQPTPEPILYENRSASNMQMALELVQSDDGLYNGALESTTRTILNNKQNGVSVFDFDESDAMRIDVAENYDETGDVLTDLHISTGTADALEPMADIALRQSAQENGDSDLFVEISDPNAEENLFNFALSKRAQENGVRYGVELGGTIDGESGALSFNLTRSAAPFENALAGDALEITEATFSDASGMDPAMLNLTADALSLTADAMELMADPGIQAIRDLYSRSMMARIDTSGLYDDDYAPDGDSALVYSLEEAAEIYAGAIPEFTMPEGFVIGEISVSPDMFELYAVKDEETFFLLSLASDVPVDASTATGGAAKNPLYYYDDDENSAIYAADVTLSDGSMCYLYFGGMNNAEIEALALSLL